jgi:ABC-2 type transport system permease protein
MGTTETATTSRLTRFRSPQTVIARFTARRTIKSAVFIAAVFGLYVTSKALGYATSYPTLADRMKIAGSFGTNVGLAALLGSPQHLESVAGFAVWNTIGIVTIFGSIWAFLLVTKTLRGEEEAGRWELLLSGQTTSARAVINAIGGLLASVLGLYLVVALILIALGHVNTVNYGPQAGLFFALAAVASIVEFLAVGALLSQLMPTRSRARTHACDPRRSASIKRRSKCSDRENRSKTSDGPCSKRPPQSFIPTWRLSCH